MFEDDPLGSEPFSYRATKNGLAQISCRGKVVSILAGKEAARFLARAETADARALQILMARATGQFKHGNERDSKQAGKRQ